jgi:hypothetical protein
MYYIRYLESITQAFISAYFGLDNREYLTLVKNIYLFTAV